MDREILKLGIKVEHPEWEEQQLLMMTPGPTQVAENVRAVRAYNVTSPIVDQRFFDFYRETCQRMGACLGTKHPFYIMNGEGILGLEAACASLTEPGDRVLVLDNGVFGRGFADFVSLYGGIPVIAEFDYRRPISQQELKDYLERDHDFKYATLVHSDTPSGVLNPVDVLCPLLKSYGILTVVDSVTGMFAEELQMDEAKIDILCGGSQKALSAPSGLTMVGVSPDAAWAMHQRKTPIASFYANLLTFENYYEEMHFPYTQPVSDIYGLRAALEDYIVDDSFRLRHRKIGAAVRVAVGEAGLSLYLQEGFASTVTAVEVPEGITDGEILKEMMETHHILISGSIGTLQGKVIRIGHMGNNANVEDVAVTLKALGEVLAGKGIALKADMGEVFMDAVRNLCHGMGGGDISGEEE